MHACLTKGESMAVKIGGVMVDLGVNQEGELTIALSAPGDLDPTVLSLHESNGTATVEYSVHGQVRNYADVHAYNNFR